MTTHRRTVDAVSAAISPTNNAESRPRLLAKSCASSGCPTIYKSDRGTLIVQGYALSADQVGLEVPEGEFLVEIPVDLLATAAQHIE